MAQRLTAAGLSAQQVQAVWLKEANANPTAAFPVHAQELKRNLATIVRVLKQKFPNLKLCYLASRIYGGYATSTLNPEPYAYESAFSVQWLIEDQIGGKDSLAYLGASAQVPWLAWGPYLWADGMKPRTDNGLFWTRADLVSDGTHPSASGQQKVANLLLDFFKTDETTKPWFLKKTGGASADDPAVPAANRMTIAPNPVTGVPRIEIWNKGLKNAGALPVEIVNALGQTVATHHLQSGATNIDVSGLPGGIYAIKAEGMMKMFIKNQ